MALDAANDPVAARHAIFTQVYLTYARGMDRNHNQVGYHCLLHARVFASITRLRISASRRCLLGRRRARRPRRAHPFRVVPRPEAGAPAKGPGFL